MDQQSSVKRHIICGVPVEQTGREVGRMKAVVAPLAAVAWASVLLAKRARFRSPLSRLAR
jgi:hypothetical protein